MSYFLLVLNLHYVLHLINWIVIFYKVVPFLDVLPLQLFLNMVQMFLHVQMQVMQELFVVLYNVLYNVLMIINRIVVVKKLEFKLQDRL